MKTISKVISFFILTLLAIVGTNGLITPYSIVVLANVTIQPTAMQPATSSPMTASATVSAATTLAATITFDFDTGLPPLYVYQSTPLAQTSDGITAHFSSPSDPAAFSIQSHDTTFFSLSQFFGNYLYQNNLVVTSLHISFSQPLTGITLTFATIEYHGAGNVEEPSFMKVTAYMDSTGTTPVGSATAQGSFSADSYPQGTLSFDSGGQPFNLVVIELVLQPNGATSFLADNIVVVPVEGAVEGTIVVNAGDTWTNSTAVTLSLTYAASGVDKVRYSNDGVWDTEPWENPTPSRAWSLEGGDGLKTVYYQIRDNVGNTYITSDSIILDTTPPTGSAIINAGDAWTNSTAVTLSLTYADATSGVDKVRYSNDGVWDTEPWENPSASKAWILEGGDGLKTVYYQIRDNAGNTYTTSDSIGLDTTVPGPPSLVSPVNGAITNDTTPSLDWSDVTNSSGVSYSLQVDNDASFSTPVIDVTSLVDSQYTVISDLAQGVYYWRVAAVVSEINHAGWSSVWSFIVLADINPQTAVSSALSNEIPPDMNAVEEADTEVSFQETGNVSGTIVVAKYDGEPTTPTIAFSTATGKEPVKFIEVWVNGFATGTATVKVHYADEEVAGLPEESLRLYYWDGDSWEIATDSGVDMNNNVVVGDIPVSALSGTPIGVGGGVSGVGASFNWAPVIGGVVGGLAMLGASFYYLLGRRRLAL